VKDSRFAVCVARLGVSPTMKCACKPTPSILMPRALRDLTRFSARAFDAVVDVVELYRGVGRGAGLEGDWDVSGADGVVEDVGAVGAVVVEGFVYASHA
jgi:hypothetical protein